MLERNLLSHLKLALLLSLLSSSLLLRARLVPEPGDPSPETEDKTGLPLAVVQIVASLAAIIAGIWEYHSGYRDLRNMRAFLVAAKYVPAILCISSLTFALSPHLAIMTVVVGAVFATCIVLLADGQ